MYGIVAHGCLFIGVAGDDGVALGYVAAYPVSVAGGVGRAVVAVDVAGGDASAKLDDIVVLCTRHVAVEDAPRGSALVLILGACHHVETGLAAVHAVEGSDIGLGQLAGRDAHGMQFAATVKGMVGYGVHTLWQTDLGETGATGKGIATDGLGACFHLEHSCATGQHRDNLSVTVVKHIVGEGVFLVIALGNVEGGETGTTGKGSHTYRGDGGRQCEGAQGTTAVEGALGHCIVGGGERTVGIGEERLAASHYAHIAEVEGAEVALRTRTVGVHTCHLAQHAQVGAVDGAVEHQTGVALTLVFGNELREFATLYGQFILYQRLTLSVYAEDEVLIVAEGVHRGIEQGYVVRSVVVAVPTPVDIYHAILSVTVEHEGMTAHPAVHTTVVHGIAIGEFLVYYVHPLLLRVV